MLSAPATARRRLVLIAATLVAAAVAVAVIVAAVARRPDRTKPVAEPTAAPARSTAAPAPPGPVLLVPGYGGATTGLDALAAVLRRHGKQVSVLDLPGDGTGDLDVQAGFLAATVRATLSRTHAASVDIVGYSAGGVVARLWVRAHGRAALARRVITLGAPHHGTTLAALAGSVLPGACPTACRQLAPGSALLAALNAGDETPAGPSFVSIWTDRDEVVVPPRSASLAGALDFTVQSVCAADSVGHGGLPTDAGVEDMVVDELAPGPPVRLSDRDCGRISS